MPTSILFQLEHGDVEFNGVSNYVLLNCLQWKSPHLEVLASATKQSFAVIYENELDQELIDYLERVHLKGALSAVSLKTCEQCGAPGKQIGSKWVSTLCPMHDGSPHAGDS